MRIIKKKLQKQLKPWSEVVILPENTVDPCDIKRAIHSGQQYLRAARWGEFILRKIGCGVTLIKFKSAAGLRSWKIYKLAPDSLFAREIYKEL